MLFHMLPEIFRKYLESSEKYSKSFQHFWCVWWPIENIQENIQKIFRKYSDNIQKVSDWQSHDLHLSGDIFRVFRKVFEKYLKNIWKVSRNDAESDRQSADSRLSGDIFPSTQKLSGKYLKNNWKVFEKYAKKVIWKVFEK